MDPYKILGIDENATEDEIKRAYHVQARKYHPDAGGDSWVFQQVNDAYQMLVDARRRPASGKDESSTANKTHRASSPSPKVEVPKEAPVGTSLPHRPWYHGLLGQLPMQNETTLFIFVNVLDIYLTYLLLNFGGDETNPIANFFFRRWNIRGLIAFKMAIVALVCVAAQLIALKNPRRAKQLLWVGTIIVSAVVVYSLALVVKHVR